MKAINVTAIIVTYNRRALLSQCLTAIASQTHKPDRVLVIDNASTDGTRGWLKTWLPANLPHARLIALENNRGGAGGFAAGLQAAMEESCDWMWMMDDDAEPHPEALERLLAVPLDPKNVYSSVALCGERLAWPIIPNGPDSSQPILLATRLRRIEEVKSVSFLGILVSASMVRSIGLPDAHYFFQFDDVEYCYRCRNAGAKIFIVGDSRIEHPLADRYSLCILGRILHVFRMPPWKRYYHVRNRIFLAKSYYGWSAYYSTAPASFLRLLATLRHEPLRWKQVWATIAGVVDGVMGRKGRRHAKWGLHP